MKGFSLSLVALCVFFLFPNTTFAAAPDTLITHTTITSSTCEEVRWYNMKVVNKCNKPIRVLLRYETKKGYPIRDWVEIEAGGFHEFGETKFPTVWVYASTLEADPIEWDGDHQYTYEGRSYKFNSHSLSKTVELDCDKQRIAADLATTNAKVANGKGVGFFYHKDFKHWSKALKDGKYNIAQEYYFKYISSIKVPNGWTVKLYLQNDLKGTPIVYTESIPFLPGMIDNKIKSVHIINNNSASSGTSLNSALHTTTVSNTKIDAAVMIANKMYLFNGKEYIMVDMLTRTTVGGARQISTGWIGLPFTKDIGSAITVGSEIIFTKGNEYTSYNLKTDRSDGVTETITKSDFGFNEFDAGFNSLNNKNIYFFKNNKHNRIDATTLTFSSSYPKSTNTSTWPGLTWTSISAAVRHGNKAYLFHGSEVAIFDLPSNRVESVKNITDVFNLPTNWVKSGVSKTVAGVYTGDKINVYIENNCIAQVKVWLHLMKDDNSWETQGPFQVMKGDSFYAEDTKNGAIYYHAEMGRDTWPKKGKGVRSFKDKTGNEYEFAKLDIRKNGKLIIPIECPEKKAEVLRYKTIQNVNSGEGIGLFAEGNFVGTPEMLVVGNYADISSLDIPNNKLGSIKIPKGWSIVVYPYQNFEGIPETFTNDIQTLPRNWRDNVLSVKIRNTNMSKTVNTTGKPAGTNVVVSPKKIGKTEGISQKLKAKKRYFIYVDQNLTSESAWERVKSVLRHSGFERDYIDNELYTENTKWKVFSFPNNTLRVKFELVKEADKEYSIKFFSEESGEIGTTNFDGNWKSTNNLPKECDNIISDLKNRLGDK